MWCPKCKSEASVVYSPTGARCGECNAALPERAPSQTTIREARDIIAKWSSSDLLDQISALPDIPEMPTPHFGMRKSSDSTEASEEPEKKRQSEPPKPADLQQGKDPDQRKPSVEEEPKKPSVNPQPSAATGKKNRPTQQYVSRPPEARQEAEEKTNIRPVKKQDIAAASLKSSAESSPAAPKQAKTGVSEDAAASQPENGSASNSETRQRRLQKRNEQRRKQRQRKAPAVAENKGQTAVKRKFRVDSPDADRQESTVPDPARNVAGGQIQSNSPKGGTRHRIDSGETVAQTLETGDDRFRTHSRPRQRYIDEPHGSGIRGPHFQVTAPRRSNLTSLTGQLLAYIGVLGLTIGTAMVIYGHFGGYSQYTPTGWLVTTVAQMMLFLGVINLVSGGIEQTNDDVSAKINHLGDQLMRIEQVTEEVLRGPKIDPRRYVDPNAPVEESQQKSVVYAERE